MLIILIVPLVEAGVTIQKLGKPRLDLSLSEGGSLVADTNYYFSGIFVGGAGAMRDGGYMSSAADKVNITTNTSHKTILVNWVTEGNITNITDGGGGTIIVESSDHSLDTGDIVTIQNTTNYDGDYTITFVDYNSFKVTVGYVIEETGDWYDKTPFPNEALGIQLYVDDSDIQDVDGNWIIGSFWSGKTYSNGYATNNISYSSLLTETMTSRFHPELSNELSGNIPSGFNKAKGKIRIAIYGGATLSDVATALSDANCEDISSISDSSLTVLGGLIATSSGTFPLDNIQINTIGGLMYDTYNGWDITNSQIKIGPLRRPYVAGTFTKSAISSYGELATNRMTFDNSYVNSASVINYLTSIGYSKSDLTFVVNSKTWVVYPVAGSYWKRIKQIGGFIYLSLNNNFDDTYPNNIFEDLEIVDGFGDYDVFATVSANGPEETNLYNVISDREGSSPIIMGIINSRTLKNTSFNFWYSLNLEIIDEEGIPISNASVIITDIDGNIYNWTSDENGTINEWVKSFDFVRTTTGFVTVTPSNYYYPFNFSISASDYRIKTTAYNITEGVDWIIVLEDKPSWNYSKDLIIEGINNSGIGVWGLDVGGNLKIAGVLYENKNASYIDSIPEEELMWGIKSIFAITTKGDLYLLGRFFENG